MAATTETSTSIKKLVRSKSGMRIVALNRSPFELCEPPWIADSECLQCMHCHVRFDLLKRRHHCRRCGHIFCSNCCEEKVALPRMCFVDPVRLCVSCVDVTRKENEFYDKHLKILMNGATFELSNSKISQRNEAATYVCRLSQDHRFIIFESGFPDRDSLEVATIQNVKVIRTSDEYRDFILDMNTDNTASGLCVRYEDERDVSREVTFTVGAASNKLQSTAWISALLKAVKMVFEARGPSTP